MRKHRRKRHGAKADRHIRAATKRRTRRSADHSVQRSPAEPASDVGFFEGLKAEDVPDGQGWAMETVQLSTHNGTHLDAPDHCHPTMNRGGRSWTIDEVPLEWCLQPGVKRDFRHLPDGYVATAGDVEAELKRMAIRSRRWKSSWSIPAPGPNTAGRITSLPAAAWATRRPCICSSVACG
jgi:hypothetical protein